MALVKKYFLFFMPVIIQGLIAVGMIPIITYYLGPKDVGVYALVNSFMIIGSAIATLGNSFILAEHYAVSNKEDCRDIVSTALFSSILVSFVFCLLILVFFQTVGREFELIRNIPVKGVYIAGLSLMVSVPWLVAIDVLTVKGTAHSFFYITVLQSILSASVTFISLKYFDQGVLALFLGAFVGSIFACIGAFVELRDNIRIRFKFFWFRKLMKLGLVSSLSNTIENVQVFVERGMISSYVGLADLGLYTHAQQYMNTAGLAVKATARSIWPVTLAEARTKELQFKKTRAAWDVTYFFMGVFALVFATFGKELISFITHGKFSEAYPYASILMLVLLSRHAGKPHTGILFSLGEGKMYSFMVIVSILIGMTFTVFLIPVFKIYGALMGFFVQQILLRLFIQFYVNKKAKIVFCDQIIVLSVVLVSALLLLNLCFNLALLAKALLLFTAVLLLIGFCIGSFRNVIKSVRLRTP